MDNQIVGQLTWNGSSVKECLHYIVYRQKIPPEKRGIFQNIMAERMPQSVYKRHSNQYCERALQFV